MKEIKRGKKGQFYLVATIVIVALLIGFASMINYSIKRDNREIYNFAEELSIEGEWVLDYEAYSGGNVFEDFAKNYSYYVSDDKEIYFVYGQSGSVEGFTYNGEQRTDLNPVEDSGNASINVEGNTFSFELQEGENFYFVMTDKYREEEYFVTSQD
jgi:hypothetical protein